MTQAEINLCSSLLHNHYGDVIKSVGTHMLKNCRPLTLSSICANLKIPPENVKPALQVLVEQNLAELDYNNHGNIAFTLRCDRVLPFMFVPRSIMYIGKQLGKTAKLVFEEMSVSMIITMSQTIKNISQEHYEQTQTFYTSEQLDEFRARFSELARRKLIKRCIKPTTVPSSERQDIPDTDLYDVPEISLSALQTSIKHFLIPINKAPKAAPEQAKLTNYEDEDIFWQPDIQKCIVLLRNNLAIDAAEKFIDKKASNVVKAMFEICEHYQPSGEAWNQTTFPVTVANILFHMEKMYNMKEKELHSYLTVLSEVGEYCFLSKGNHRGRYVVNTKKIIDKLAEEATIKIVLEKFGSNCCRIYRLVLKEKHIEQKDAVTMSMLPPKDAKYFLYTLMEQCFVEFLQIPKFDDNANAANRMIYLFHVNLNSVCRRLLQLTYKILMNVTVFSEVFTKKYTRLFEKKATVDKIIADLQKSNAKQEEIDNVFQALTPHERNTIETVLKSRNDLGVSISQCIDTILILQCYVRFSCRS